MHSIFSQLCSFFVSNYHYKTLSPEVSRSPQITDHKNYNKRAIKKKLTKINMLVSSSLEQALLLQDSSWVLIPLSWYFSYLIPTGNMPFCSLLDSIWVSYGTKLDSPYMFFIISEGRGNIACSWDNQQVQSIKAVPGKTGQTDIVAQGGPYGHGLLRFVTLHLFHPSFSPVSSSWCFVAHSGHLWPRLRRDIATGICTPERHTSASPLPLPCHSPLHCCTDVNTFTVLTASTVTTLNPHDLIM